MKSIMRTYVYWPKMNQNIQNLVTSCRVYILAAELPPVNYQSWTNTDKPCSRLHIDYARPVNGAYYLIVVDIFFKMA